MDYKELLDILTDESNPNVLDYIEDAVTPITELLARARGAEARAEKENREGENIPTKTIREDVQGTWKWDHNGMDFNLGAWVCSNCSMRNNCLPLNENMDPFMFPGSKFCPNCGAKMPEHDLKEDEPDENPTGRAEDRAQPDPAPDADEPENTP